MEGTLSKEKRFLKKNKATCGVPGWQSFGHLTLGFSSGHDLTVCEFKPCIRLPADGPEPVWDSLSPSLSAPPLLCLSK